MDCIFCKIVAREIPAKVELEDERVVVFHDVRPQAPTHLLVVPRVHIASLHEIEDPELGGALLLAARAAARKAGLEAGWRLISNVRGHGGQEVEHLHLHVLGGRPLGRMLPSAASK